MNKMKNYASLQLKDVKINDTFWSNYIRLVQDVVIPYQWEALNDRVTDAEPSHSIRNFKIAAGLEEGEFYGYVFQDTDLAKWLEAVAYRLATHPDAALESLADEAIGLVEKAQQEDGYLNTYFTVKEPGKKWTNLRECHELYTAGHMIEAAVAYYQSTGKRKLLDVMIRFADYIDTVFGPEPDKLKGYDGHQEIELALAKLYHVTGDEKYLKLSKYFIDERGKEPYYFDIESEKRGHTVHFHGHPTQARDYNQTHLPVRMQNTAEGHAVRAVYMCTGMADVAMETGDKELFETCRTLWNNIVSKRMYVTGGIGSVAYGEAFTFDYDLPNDTMYTETCASVGLIFFAHRMLKAEAKSQYADVMESSLYNTVLAGMSYDGKRFFYVNPLEVLPEASEKNKNREHVKPVRQKWFSCACCPPNVARLLMSLGQYIYTVGENTIYTHLYIGGESTIDMEGTPVKLAQETNYPWDGKIKLKVSVPQSKKFKIALRIPGWCKEYAIEKNGRKLEVGSVINNGYVMLDGVWDDADLIELNLSMPIEQIQSNPKVRANAGRLALQRGPLVYCLEEIDNGSNLSAISMSLDAKLTAEYDGNLLDGAVTIKGNAYRTDDSEWDGQLYRTARENEKPVKFKAVPYCMWGNRTPGEMLVWFRQK